MNLEYQPSGTNKAKPKTAPIGLLIIGTLVTIFLAVNVVINSANKTGANGFGGFDAVMDFYLLMPIGVITSLISFSKIANYYKLPKRNYSLASAMFIMGILTGVSVLIALLSVKAVSN